MRSRLPQMAVGLLGNYAEGLNHPIQPGAKGRRKSRLEARRLVQVLTVGNWLYRSVRLIENNWRTEVLEGKTPYDPNEEQAIGDMLRQWMSPCQQCLEQIKKFRRKRIRVRGAKAFEGYCVAAAEILAGRNAFFEDTDKAWRWSALTSGHRISPRGVRVDDAGRLFEVDGRRFVPPGLTPKDVLEAFSEDGDERAKPLKSITTSRTSNEIRDQAEGEGTGGS